GEKIAIELFKPARVELPDGKGQPRVLAGLAPAWENTLHRVIARRILRERKSEDSQPASVALHDLIDHMVNGSACFTGIVEQECDQVSRIGRADQREIP